MTSGVVVTGIGLVTPLGWDRESTWTRLLNGETGICQEASGLTARIHDFPLNGARSRMGDFVLRAASEAFSQADLSKNEIKNSIVGCAIGQSKPLLGKSMLPNKQGLPLQLDPSLLLSSFMGWSADAVVRREFSLFGPSSNPIAACATGVAAFQTGMQWLLSGDCEIALVGAAESSFHPLYRSAFAQMGVLAEGDPESVCPFDARRQGFVMGEGAAVFVLETLEHAAARGQNHLAQIRKCLMRHDPTGTVRFDSSGAYVAKLIFDAVEKSLPHYVNAHGTGTVFNDLMEAQAIRTVFGSQADEIPVSSTKASTGHLLGAAGAVEAAICVLSLRDQKLPPTLHLTTPDPACQIKHVFETTATTVDAALSLSYGFGGQMGAIYFER